MKIALALFLSMLVVSVLAGGGFSNSCETITINPKDAVLRAECKNKQGIYILAYIDLNHCYTNSNGNMVPRCQGRFQNSCGNLVVTPPISQLTDISYLTADCREINGGVIESHVVLDDVVANQNGVLSCGC